ncbi:MAG: hypothetical protein ACFFD4_05370 [Candidatus Odinarchaeota archaeon]
MCPKTAGMVLFCSILLLLLIMTPFPVLAETDTTEIIHGINQDFPLVLDYYKHSSGGFVEEKEGAKALAFTMALSTIGMTSELLNIPPTVKELPFSIDTALSPLRWAAKYFDDPYARDNRGYVSFYDITQGDDSYARASKRSTDQALMIRAMAQGVQLLNRNNSNNAEIPQWKKAINETWSFIDGLYDPEYGGWGIDVTPINRTHHTTDWSKTVESNGWVIISLLPVRGVISEATGLSIDVIQSRCFEAMDFLGSHLFEVTGQVRPFTSRDGTVTAEFTTCRDVALFGLAAMECYRAAGNDTYLDWAKKAADHALVELWDNGFGAFFGAVSDEGDVLIAGKKTEDNLLIAQLLCQLVSHDTGDLYEPILVNLLSILRNTIGEYIEYEYHYSYHITAKILYPTAVDRKLISNGIFNARTQGVATFSLSQLPHISYIEQRSFYPIGRETPITLNIQLGYLPRILLTLEGHSFDLEMSKNITLQEPATIQIIPPQGTPVRKHDLYLALSLRQVGFETLSIRINCGGDIVIPQGVLYLLAMGVIVGVVIVIISPPARLKEWADSLFISSSSGTDLSKEERKEYNEIREQITDSRK